MWSDAYVGLPWADKGRDRAGINCWGLHRLILIEQKTIEVSAYTEAYTTTVESQEIAALFAQTREWPWLPVQAGQEQPFDLIVFAACGVDYHCATVVRPGLMVHIERDHLSCITTYRDLRHRARQASFYRHASL